jgi:hypothetical protein
VILPKLSERLAPKKRLAPVPEKVGASDEALAAREQLRV